jgi:hypothetical protein
LKPLGSIITAAAATKEEEEEEEETEDLAAEEGSLPSPRTNRDHSLQQITNTTTITT